MGTLKLRNETPAYLWFGYVLIVLISCIRSLQPLLKTLGDARAVGYLNLHTSCAGGCSPAPM